MLPAELVAALRARRRRLRLNQAALAARIGVAARQIGRWERREHSPSLDGFCAWCEELGVAIDLKEAAPCLDATDRPTRIP